MARRNRFIVIIALCSTAASTLAQPALVLEVSGIVLLLDKGPLLRIVLPDIQAEHNHIAFIQFPAMNLVNPNSLPPGACKTKINGVFHCTVQLTGGQVLKIGPPGVLIGPPLGDISAQIGDAIPIREIATGGALKPIYDRNPPDASVVAAQMDLTTGALGISPNREPVKWDFKKDATSALKDRRCVAEAVVIGQLLKAATTKVTIAGIELKTNTTPPLKITVGNMMPNDMAGIQIPKPTEDVHYSIYYDFLDYNGDKYRPFKTAIACPPPPAMTKSLETMAPRMLWRPNGSNCPPGRIK